MAGLMKADTAGLLQKKFEPPKLPDVKIEAAGPDLLGQINRMAATAQKKHTPTGGLVTVETGLIRDAVLSPAEKWVRQARALIKEKKYVEARVPLARAKKEDAGHVMAFFLDGLCCYHLKDDWAALESLVPVHGKAFPDAKTAQVYTQLMTLIRKRMLPKVVEETLPQFNTDKRDATLARLKRLLQLDPAVAVYHSLFAVGLCAASRWDAAMTAVDVGLAACPQDEAADLRQLRAQIVEQRLFAAMQSAVPYYRATDYTGARAVLAGMDADLRALPLWKTFDDYLARLTGWFGKKSVEKVWPAGAPAQVQALYHLLVGQEINSAQVMLLLEQYDVADDFLRQALQLAPRFGFANFLAALSLYRHMASQLAAGVQPSPEDLVFALKKAQSLCGRALECGFASAQELLNVLEPVIASLEEHIPPPEEARRINGLIDEFTKAVKLGEGGITSLKHLDRVLNALKTVGKRIGQARCQVQSRPGVRTLDSLDEAVGRHCQQLQEMRQAIQEVETFGRHFVKFQVKMEAINRGGAISTRAELESLRSFFRSLRSDAERDWQSMTTREARDQMNQLIQDVSQIQQQLG